MKGLLEKMEGTLHHGVTQYRFVLSEKTQDFLLNDFVGKDLKLTFTGKIQCISCGRLLKKTFQQGYCFPCVTSLAECDLCIVNPHQCHFHKGTCRDETWGKENCFIPHVVYLANSSQLKVGVTKVRNIPTRWIDQGATQALPILKTTNRYHAGLFEKLFSEVLSDKTNWRQMLMGNGEKFDLVGERKKLFSELGEAIDSLEADLPEGVEFIEETTPVDITYPVLEFPQKIHSLSFEKEGPEIGGKLLGIKGQYLIFDCGVFPVRKHTGHEIEVYL